MNKNQKIYIGNEDDVNRVVRELLFYEHDNEIDSHTESIKNKYESLSKEQKLFIQSTIMKLLGGDIFGYNFTVILEEFITLDNNVHKNLIGTMLLKVREPIKDKFDSSTDYTDAFKSLKRTNFPRKENQKEIIKLICDFFMITEDLLYTGNGKIYIVEEWEFETHEYKTFSQTYDINDYSSTLEWIKAYQQYLEELYPHLYERTNIIKTKHIKILNNASYLALKKTKSFNHIKNYIDFLITDLIDCIDLSRLEIK